MGPPEQPGHRCPSQTTSRSGVEEPEAPERGSRNGRGPEPAAQLGAVLMPRGSRAIAAQMQSSTIDIKTEDGVADAYVTRPDDQPHPGVLFIMDAFGLRPRIEEMADRIAARGYVVLAPNVFYRAGRAPVTPVPDLSDPDNRASFFQSLRPLMDQLTPEAVARDGAAYLDYLEQVAQGPVAITGYCMGGRVGWRIAAAHPDRVAALASFHGAAWSRMHPTARIDRPVISKRRSTSGMPIRTPA